VSMPVGCEVIAVAAGCSKRLHEPPALCGSRRRVRSYGMNEMSACALPPPRALNTFVTPSECSRMTVNTMAANVAAGRRKPAVSIAAVAVLMAAWIVATCGQRAAASPFVPGQLPSHPVALVGGTVHTVDGETIENGVVLFKAGKIVAVGKVGDSRLSIPADAETIDVSGKHVYPGLFDAHTHVGLVEVDSIRATRDQAETGLINPNVKAQVAFNPDSEHIPVTRAGGVLVALAAPSGGLLTGTSSVMQLDGWSWEDMAVRPTAGMHLIWPRAIPVRTWANDNNATDQLKERAERLKQIREAFESARAYQRAKASRGQPGATTTKSDARWEAMLPVLKGELPLIVSANEITQIQEAVAFAAEQKVKLIIFGGYDAGHCAELLKQHDVPVIISGVNRLPQRRDDGYDAPFTLAARLEKAGVRFCISGDESTGNVRNLNHHAAVAAAFGLSRESALRAITLSPAEILGVENRLGSLTPGKDATLIVTSGDILELTTKVEQAYIGGRPVDLSNRHTELWKKYREKYRRQAEQAAE